VKGVLDGGLGALRAFALPVAETAGTAAAACHHAESGKIQINDTALGQQFPDCEDAHAKVVVGLVERLFGGGVRACRGKKRLIGDHDDDVGLILEIEQALPCL